MKHGYVKELSGDISVMASSASAGKEESEGPLAEEYDIIFRDDKTGEETWEKAESRLVRKTVEDVIKKAGLKNTDIDVILAGDLLNQCTASTYGLKDFGIPFCGLYGACSTMAYSLALSSILVDSGYFDIAAAAASSHFCSAEKQFRYPLEYGGQRPPTAQRTVTGAGAFIIGKNCSDIKIKRVMIGKVSDYGIKDISNMGAAMAPAAAESIYNFLSETGTSPGDYSMILTGDLGKTGSELLLDFMKEKYNTDISAVHNDCGMMVYDLNRQDVDSGGSGCGCSAIVTASYIMNRLKDRTLKRVLFAGTGALMSPLVSLQGSTIPAIAHITEFSV